MRQEPVWRRYLRFVRPDVARDVDDELAFHLSMREAEFMSKGLSPEDARAQAQARFGPVQDARKATLAVDRRYMKAVRRAQLFDNFRQDLRLALRGLRQHVGFSAAVIGTLALGIGATTAMFSAVDAALLRPLPFADPSRLAVVPGVQVPFAPNGVSALPSELPDVTKLQEMRDVFSHVAVYAPGGLNLSGDGEALRVNVALVTPSFFSTLGVQPSGGRAFSADDGRIGAGQVVVLSYGLWQRRYGGGAVLGTSLQLNGRSYQVVGVMPRGFVFPRESDLWLPLSVPTTFQSFEAFRSWIPSTTIVRLQPGVTREAVASRLRELWKSVPEQFRESTADYATNPLRALQGSLIGDRQKPLLILLMTTGLLLLIACANVTSLLLARAATRRREVAMRAVLGASRGRLASQLLVESLLLAFAGSACGVAIAYASLGTVRTLMPATLIAVAPPAVDVRVLGFAILLALITGLGFGLWPAVSASRADANETLKSSGGAATAGGAGRVRRFLVAAELAVALTLLAGSMLMLRSFQRLVDTDPGYRTERVGTLELTFAQATAPNGDATRFDVLRRVVDRLAAMPGVEAAGIVNDLPLRGSNGLHVSITPEGRALEPDQAEYARYLQASSGYFKALGIQLLRGRLVNETDTRDAPHVLVVNAALAKKLWPGEDPIGKRVVEPQGRNRDGSIAPPAYRTVVGVVADVRESQLEQEASLQMYYPVAEQTPQNAAIVARGTVDAATMLAYLRTAVREASPAQPVYNVRMMDDVIAASLSPRRLNTTLITAFGALALLLSVVGVYGVVAYGVTRRTRELGIRAALGATSPRLIGLVAGESALVALAGIAAGLGGAWAFSRALASLLYEVKPSDAATFIAAPLVLFGLVIVATLVPARRAARLNPVDVMRND